jgi:hypothetical protein
VHLFTMTFSSPRMDCRKKMYVISTRRVYIEWVPPFIFVLLCLLEDFLEFSSVSHCANEHHAVYFQNVTVFGKSKQRKTKSFGVVLFKRVSSVDITELEDIAGL